MSLPYSIRMELLQALLTGQSLKPVIQKLEIQELLGAHRFVYEKTIEFGIKMRGRRFEQDELLATLQALADDYTNRICLADRPGCQLQECALLFPQCARGVASEQIIAMARAIKEYLLLNEPR
jgi:hypothetical protein